MGREQAFLDATLPYVDVVWNVARRMTANRDAAEDLVQETFLRAYQGFAGKRDGGVRSWLVSIRLNAARSQRRRAVCRPLEDLAADPEPYLRAWIDDPDEAVRRLVSAGTRPRLPWVPQRRARPRS